MLPGLPNSPFLYPILDADFSSDPLKDARDIIRAGIKILQFRAKKETNRRIHEIMVALGPLCVEFQVCLIINDFVDILLTTDCSGVHLGQGDFPVKEARALSPGKVIGISTHDAQQFQVANEFPVDYIALGPVYESTTKRSSNPALGLSGITPLLKTKSKPVVGIGGIQEHHFRQLLAVGLDGIAVISELYRGGDLYTNTRRMLDEIRTHEEI